MTKETDRTIREFCEMFNEEIVLCERTEKDPFFVTANESQHLYAIFRFDCYEKTITHIRTFSNINLARTAFFLLKQNTSIYEEYPF